MHFRFLSETIKICAYFFKEEKHFIIERVPKKMYCKRIWG